MSFVALLPKVEGVGTCRGAGVLRRFVAENSFVWLTALSGIPRVVWNTNVILLLYYYLPVIIQVIFRFYRYLDFACGWAHFPSMIF